MTIFFDGATIRRGVAVAPLMRWLAIVVMSVLLHWLFLAWTGFTLGPTMPAPLRQEAVTVALRSPPPAPVSAALPLPVAKAVNPKAVPPKPKPVPAKVAKPSLPLESASTLSSTPAEPTTDGAVAKAGDAGNELPMAALPEPLPEPFPDPLQAPSPARDEPAQPTLATPQDTAADTPVAPAPGRVYRVSTPPSADLQYDVQAFRDGQHIYGSGSIVWQPADDRYRIDGKAGILFFNVLDFHSEGSLDGTGLAPVVYSEKRFRKPPTSTYFHHERGVISFSASPSEYPRTGSEQDRASIVWQLAGIGRGDPQAFQASANIALFVAGARNGETWHVRVSGEEDIQVAAGAMRAWHVVREPRAGSYDQRLDIWFAPQREWYPVRLRYTETNGDWLEMSLSAIRGIAAR